MARDEEESGPAVEWRPCVTEVGWVGVDEPNWLAFLARPPQSLPARARRDLQDSIDYAQIESETHGDKSTIVIRWDHLTPEPQAPKLLLRSWFELGPFLRYERYARCPRPTFRLANDSPVSPNRAATQQQTYGAIHATVPPTSA